MEARIWHRQYDPWIQASMRYPKITIPDFLHLAANAVPDKTFTHFYGSELTFREIRLQSMRMANALAALGVTKGDRVALHLPNCPQYVIAYFGILSLGAIVVNMNPLYTAPELKHAAELTTPKAFITFDMVIANVRGMLADVDIPHVIVTRVTDYVDAMPTSTAAEMGLEDGRRHFSELIEAEESAKLPKVDIAYDDTAVIIFTGGTTGIPKGAALTHANYSAANFVLAAWGGNITPMRHLSDQQSVLAVMPFFHAYGQVCCLNWAITNCAKLVMVPRFELEEFVGIISGLERITFFPAVPTLFNALTNHPRAEELELDTRFQLVNSGAAPMPNELIDRIKDLNVPYSEGWGMTETTSLGVANPVVGLKKAGSIGVPFPDMDVKIVAVEDASKEVAPGEPGELLVKGPLVMKEYWGMPKETAEHIKDGWLHTGDVVTQDEDGYLYVVDRKKDMIIAGGYNIYPREVDEALFRHPKIREAVTIGIPDEYRGETVKAFVVLKEGEDASEQEIIDFCRESLAAYKAPKMVEFRNELPKSAVGKILRKKLREEELAKQG